MSLPVCVLVDDTRSFRTPRGELVARTSAEALVLVRSLHAAGTTLAELWLDYDLGLVDAEGRRTSASAAARADTVMELLTQLEEWAFSGHPLPIERVWIHTSNASGRESLLRSMRRWGYAARIVDADTHLIADPVLSAWE